MTALKSHPARKLLMPVASIALLFLALWMAGAKQAIQDLSNFPLWAIVVVLALFGLNLAVVSFRLARVMSRFGIRLPPGVAANASISGYVAGLFFISLFGQVIGRHLILRRHGVSPVLIATLTAYERIVLLIVSGGLCIAGAIILLDQMTIAKFLTGISVWEIVLATTSSLVMSSLLGRSKFESQLIARACTGKSLIGMLEITGITLLAQLTVLAAFVAGGLALQPDVDFWSLLAASAIISFAASLPISVNGWGVREIASIYAFGQLGIPSSSAFAISILVGLCSTAAIAAAAPFVLRKTKGPTRTDTLHAPEIRSNAIDLEKAAVWLMAMATAIFIFFQLHIALPDGVINLNLADPLAILALAAVAMQIFATRQLPRWRVPQFNAMLFATSALLLLAFCRGALEIGVTQWALAGRLMGWLVLLGYLSIGYLIAAGGGRQGQRRIIQTMIATAIVIILLQIILRWSHAYGWVSGLSVPMNFEGYAGNRNAFAFQLLVCSALALNYSHLNWRFGRCTNAGSPFDARRSARSHKGLSRLLPWGLLHGVILTGLILSASRAGMITGAILLTGAWALKLADRRTLVLSVVIAMITWLLLQILQVAASDAFAAVQSPLSGEDSNQERWESITRGLDMWRHAPMLGAGLGVFIERSPEWFGHPLVIHSTPVWILAEFGLLGALVFSWIFLTILLHVYKHGPLSTYRMTAMLLFAFAVFGLAHEIFYQRIFWLVLGIALAANTVPQPKKKSAPAPTTHG